MRKIVKTILSKSRALKKLKYFHSNKLVIFNYHRIRDVQKPTHFNEDVFGADAVRFRQEMEWLKNETRILSEDELIEIVYNKKPINEMCSMVTFDDGYSDNFDIAFPILKELNIPAMFFIPTYHLTERKVGWWDAVAYMIKHTSRKSFTFQNSDYSITDPKILINKFTQELKSTDADRIDGYLQELSKTLNQALPDSETQSRELMTWEQIKILNDNGMSIGTHSHDHSILSKQNNIRLKAQLEKSIEILESVIHKKIKSIAYPVGGYNHFNQDTKMVCKDIGLKLGFSFLTGINQWEEIDPFDVRRLSIEPQWVNLDIPFAFPNLFLKCKKEGAFSTPTLTR